VEGDNQYAGALIRLSTAVQSVFHDLSREHDLTPQQAILMCQLIERPVGMAELAMLLHIEKSTLTGLVDRAERRGLVCRAPDPEDRRAVRVDLTPRGRKAVTDFQDEVTRTLTKHVEHLPARTRQNLRGALPQAAAAYWDSLG
jgi:DNA-binding MarR family transcriptional regulator